MNIILLDMVDEDDELLQNVATIHLHLILILLLYDANDVVVHPTHLVLLDETHHSIMLQHIEVEDEVDITVLVDGVVELDEDEVVDETEADELEVSEVTDENDVKVAVETDEDEVELDEIEGMLLLFVDEIDDLENIVISVENAVLIEVELDEYLVVIGGVVVNDEFDEDEVVLQHQNEIISDDEGHLEWVENELTDINEYSYLDTPQLVDMIQNDEMLV